MARQLFAALALLAGVAACGGEGEAEQHEGATGESDAGPRKDTHVTRDAGRAAASSDASHAVPSDSAAGGGSAPGDESESSSGVTYQRDIRPLLEANCVECHNAGGIGPSRLDDWQTVRTLGPAIVSAVSAGRMPPWPARDACHEIADSRALSQATRERFAQWQRDGFLEGRASDYVAPAVRRRQELGAASLTMMGGAAFTPAADDDTYRCFYVGDIPSNTYVTAVDIIPGVRSQVHHVQVHRVDAIGATLIQATDPGDGYPCNSAGVGGIVSSENLFSYRPGAMAVVLEEGDAVYLEGGSGLVLQIHYNTQFLPSGQEPEPDRTRVELWTLPEGQPPSRVVYRTGVLSPLNGSSTGGTLDLSRAIPANQANVVGESTLPMSQISTLGRGITLALGLGAYLSGEIVGMTPHAHAWAKRMVASLAPEAGGEECLIDIPDWDYNWQLDYMFAKGIPYGPDDVLHVACDYDNTAANQPIINGMRRQPQDVTFGENTLNEMCLHYIWLRFPYADFAAANF